MELADAEVSEIAERGAQRVVSAGAAGGDLSSRRAASWRVSFVVTSWSSRTWRGGTAAQVRALIATAKERVYDRFGVRLTPEIEDLGEPS